LRLIEAQMPGMAGFEPTAASRLDRVTVMIVCRHGEARGTELNLVSSDTQADDLRSCLTNPRHDLSSLTDAI
jgi:hypothetical protein